MSVQYISKPSRKFKELREKLNREQFYLLARLGPTVFNVKDNDDNVYKITLGQPSICTCGACDINNKDNESLYISDSPCIHMIYCLVKVLRVPDTNPFCWQVSYSDRQMDLVLDVSAHQAEMRRRRRQPHTFLRRGNNNNDNQKDDDDNDNDNNDNTYYIHYLHHHHYHHHHNYRTSRSWWSIQLQCMLSFD